METYVCNDTKLFGSTLEQETVNDMTLNYTSSEMTTELVRSSELVIAFAVMPSFAIHGSDSIFEVQDHAHNDEHPALMR